MYLPTFPAGSPTVVAAAILRAKRYCPQVSNQCDIIPLMGNAKKSNEFEPTLMDVLDAVQTGFTKMEEKMEERFDKVDEQLGNVENRVTAVERRVGTIEVTLEDMKETLESIEHAIDKDAEAVVNHESRISHLEKLSGIETIPVAHLANLEISE